jgi:hypothetical protein
MNKEINAEIVLLTGWITELNKRLTDQANYLQGTMECVTSMAKIISDQDNTIKVLEQRERNTRNLIDIKQSILQAEIDILFQFKKTIEAYPKISIKSCKKCDHDTLFRDNPDNTFTCLICGTTFQKTHQEFIREIKR